MAHTRARLRDHAIAAIDAGHAQASFGKFRRVPRATATEIEHALHAGRMSLDDAAHEGTLGRRILVAIEQVVVSGTAAERAHARMDLSASADSSASASVSPTPLGR